MKKLVVTAIVLIAISIFMLSAATFGNFVSARGANQDTPLCLWQKSGGRPINHLITSADECARLFERYADTCTDESGTLQVQTNTGETVNFQYDIYCRKMVGGSSFTVLSASG